MKLSVGPILYLWQREAALQFYAELCDAPVDVVYLGEVVCSKRRVLQREDWHEVAQALSDSGKEVVFSTLALIEAQSELSTLASTLRETAYAIEANDYAAVELSAERRFVAGPHMNVYNAATLAILARRGAYRWAAPIEMPLATLATIADSRPPGLEIEAFAYGRMPLAFSARCFTARAHQRAKDDCGFVCGEYPDGLTMYTQEQQPFLTLNGIQTQSAAVQNLLPHLPQLHESGVDVLRLSPQSNGFFDVVRAFRRALDGESIELPAATLPGGYCDGYVSGAAGLARVDPTL